MRTLVLTVMLIVVAVATGASFVVRAQGAASATLAANCEPRDRPSGVDVLLTCTFTARNTGSSTIENATLGFQPAQGLDIPDRYYFWGRRIDSGPGLAVHPAQLSYDLGDIDPSETRRLTVDVIVRASRRSGADAVLYTAGGSDELARVTLAGDVTEAPADVGLGLDLVEDVDAPGRYLATVVIAPISGGSLATLAVGLEAGWAVEDRPADLTGDASFVRVTFREGLHLTADTVNTFEFVLQAPEACAGGTVAVVAITQSSDGNTQNPAVLAPIDYDDACYAGGAPTGLPAGGDRSAATPTSAIDLLAALGVALIGAGWLMRRVMRP